MTTGCYVGWLALGIILGHIIMHVWDDRGKWR